MASADTEVMTTALHITLITETFPPEINGVANTLGRLCDGLRARGHQVELVRPRQGATSSWAATMNCCCVGAGRCRVIPVCNGVSHRCTSCCDAGNAIDRTCCTSPRRDRWDCRHCARHGAWGSAVVSGFHTNFQQYTSQYGLGLLTRLLTHYLRWFHNRSTLTLVPSISQRLELERRHFERLALLSRGVDSQLFHPAKRLQSLREQWGLAENDIAVIHVGRLAPEKNTGLLKRSFDALKAAYPQRTIKLIVVGDGPQRVVLEKELPEAIFCGSQRGEALASHYASGDLFLFPSLTETFGNVVLEALASGLGVVSYDRPRRPSIFAMATTACWRCRGMKRRFAMQRCGCWRRKRPCAAYGSMRASMRVARGGRRLSSSSRGSCGGLVLGRWWCRMHRSCPESLLTLRPSSRASPLPQDCGDHMICEHPEPVGAGLAREEALPGAA